MRLSPGVIAQHFAAGRAGRVRRLLKQAYALNALPATSTPATNASHPWNQVGWASGQRRRVPVTIAGKTFLGDLIEDTRTNYLLRSRTTGAELGVIGSGGALPTGWVIGSVVGVTTEVMAFDADSITLRFNGTVVSGTAPGFATAITAVGSFAVGDLSYASCTAQKVSGSATVDQVLMFGQESNAAGAQLAAYVGSVVSLAAGTEVSVAASRTLNQATTSRLQMGPRVGRWVATAGDVFTNYTIKFSWLQLEKAAFPSSYIPTDGAAVTRGADSLSVSLASLPGGGLGQVGTIFAPFMPYGWGGVRADTSVWRVFSTNAAGNATTLSGNGATGLNAFRRDSADQGGSSTVPTYASRSLRTGAVTWDATAVRPYAQGAAGAADTTLSAPYATDSILYFCNVSSGSRCLFGAALGLYWPFALAAADIADIHAETRMQAPSV
jgi:hypothetical protein